MSLYTDLIEAGQPVSNHYSDLYTPVNEVTRALIKRHRCVADTFINRVEGGIWFDVPFAFEPYWESRS